MYSELNSLQQTGLDDIDLHASGLQSSYPNKGTPFWKIVRPSSYLSEIAYTANWEPVYSKVQTQNKKYATIQRCVKSYFSSLTNLLASLPNPSPQEITKGQEEDDEKKNLLYLALNESSKLIPFLGSNRRVAKDYLRVRLSSSLSSVHFVKIFR